MCESFVLIVVNASDSLSTTVINDKPHQYVPPDSCLSPVLILILLDQHHQERDQVDNICHRLPMMTKAQQMLRLSLILLWARAVIGQNNCSIHMGLQAWYGVIIPVKLAKCIDPLWIPPQVLQTGRRWRASKESKWFKCQGLVDPKWTLQPNGCSWQISAVYNFCRA